jgi:dolichol-phosphate mannosyltransferase
MTAPDPSAGKASGRGVTVIVPTYREAENLPALAARLAALRESDGLDLELLIVDDASPDGTPAVVAGLGLPWVRLIVRTTERGLSTAVIEGLRQARHDLLVVMDADLSHPPERIPALVAALDAGADMAFGSRYVGGASTEEGWGLVRWLNSQVATMLAAPLTRIRDPMSGFFALRRATFARAAALNPVGYKIGLELIVKCHARDVREVPIHFANRFRGESKLSLAEQLRYIKHLRRLYLYQFTESTHFAHFIAVGLAGLAVNLLILTALQAAGMDVRLAVAIAIGVSMLGNFLLNRRFTFYYARGEPILRQFAGFVAACSLGALINYGVTVALATRIDFFARWPQIAALFGVAAGTVSNYAMSRWVVFRKRPPPRP